MPRRPRRWPRSPCATASRSPRPRPARARSPGIIRSRSARSGSPARRPPTRSPPRPTSSSRSAPGLPGELHKLWRVQAPGSYHLEYGYSCMGYEIAGGLGVKLAAPEREVFVLVGDGSYLMMNSEIATSIALRCKLVIVLLDNGG